MAKFECVSKSAAFGLDFKEINRKNYFHMAATLGLPICVKHFTLTVKPSLVSKRKLHVPVGTGPSTYAQYDSAHTPQCVWAEQRSRFWFIHGWMRGRIESSLNIYELLLFYLSAC